MGCCTVNAFDEFDDEDEDMVRRPTAAPLEDEEEYLRFKQYADEFAALGFAKEDV